MGLTAAEWRYPLYRADGGWWQRRIRIAIANQTPRAAEGQPASVRIGNAPGEADLVGQRAEAVRLCNREGVEMLFAIYGPHEDPIVRGLIPAGSTLVFPVECKEHQSASYYVYFDNPDAGEVPDFFAARPSVFNGDMEQDAAPGDSADAPAGWTHDAPDAQHRATWTTENPQSGKRCLKTVVDEGAPSTWIATRQGDIGIVGGAKYRMTAWVKAENVKGVAGWYIHIGTAENPMLVGPTLGGGGGTYGWKEVSVEFSVPAEANLARLGTMLHGTGTAWFDNVRLEWLEPGREGLKVLAEKPERMTLADAGAHAPWRDAPAAKGAPDTAAAYDHRVAVRLFNSSSQAIGKRPFTIDGAMIAARSRGGLAECLVLDDAGKPIRANCTGDRLLFETDVPARSVRTCHVYWRGDRGCPLRAGNVAGKPGRGDVTLSGWNLVKNPDFSLGGVLPANWTHDSPPAGSKIEFAVEDSGRPSVGKRCVKMHVPSGTPSGWRGWHQSMPVQPGRNYFVSAWVKCKDVSESIAVHIHQHTAKGGTAATGSIGPVLTATTDWTLLSGMIVAMPETTSFELHLTTQGAGTLWHGGVTVVEAGPAMLGRVEGRPARSPAQLDVWQMLPVIKAFQDDLPPRAAAPLRISAARNEREPLQLAVRAGRDVSQVRVEVDAPRGPKNVKLADWEINVVGYVPIDYASAYYAYYSHLTGAAWRRMIPNGLATSDGWPGRWPDPLLPKDTFDLAANTTQPLWITVAVPKGVPAGDYRGVVRLVAGGRRLWQQPFTVHVWDFGLPDENHVAAKFDVGAGPGYKWWKKPWDKVRPEIVTMMARRRLCPERVCPEPVFKYENGKATADFTEFDRASEHYFHDLKLPYAWAPSLFYAFGWGFPPSAFFGQQPYAGEPPFEKVDRGQLQPEYKKAYQACLKLFWDHVKQKGWDKNFVLYISDEPFYTKPHIILQMKALCRMIHEVDRKIPIYSSTWFHVPEWDDSLDIWGIGHYGSVPVKQIAKLRSAGSRVWWTTDGQICTDTPYCAVERLLPHYCFQYGVEAYEFWGVSWTTYDPNHFGWHAFIHQTDQPGQSYWVRYPNGDGFLTYPGQPIGYDRPLSSIRLEQARDGVEDYEYLYLLRQLTQKAKAAGKDTTAADQALARAKRLVTIPNAGGCYSSKILPDPEELYLLREQVGRAIEGLRLTSTAARESFQWGVNGHPVSQEGYVQVPIAAQLDLVAKLGAGWYRMDWGTDAAGGDTARFDRLVAEAGRRKIRLLPVLFSPNGRSPNATPEQIRTAAAAFARTVVGRYKGQITHWELSNELDNYAMIHKGEKNREGKIWQWGDAVGDRPEHYEEGRYQKAKAEIQGLYEGVKAADPSATTVVNTGGWLHYGFVDRLCKEDHVPFDILAWHWYSGMGDMTNVEGKLNMVELLVGYGRPLWITEINRNGGSMDGKEKDQADYVGKAAAQLRGNPAIAALFIYELLDEPYFGQKNAEAHYGLVEIVRDNKNMWQVKRQKEAFEVLKAVIAGSR
jgi:uncharacterized protein YjbJ (UPF0337 family)